MCAQVGGTYLPYLPYLPRGTFPATLELQDVRSRHFGRYMQSKGGSNVVIASLQLHCTRVAHVHHTSRLHQSAAVVYVSPESL